MDIVVADHCAGGGTGRTSFSIGASTVLRRGPVRVIEAVGDDASLVLVPLTVLYDQMTGRLSTRVAESAVLCVGMSKYDITVATGTYIVRRVAHIVRVGMVNQTRTAHITGEDAI